MIPSRRTFIRTSLTASAGLALSPFASFAKTKFPPIGLQTYTVPFLLGGYAGTDKSLDVKAGLKKLASIGIKELETVGGLNGLYHGYKPKEFAALVKDCGMNWISHHSLGLLPSATLGQLGVGQSPDSIHSLGFTSRLSVDDCAEAGIGYVVCASSTVNTSDEIKKTAELFVKAGEACKKAGLQFAYHNHQSELHPSMALRLMSTS